MRARLGIGIAAIALIVGVGAFFLGRVSVDDSGAAHKESYLAGRARGLAIAEEIGAADQDSAAIETARYAALVLDLWQTYDRMLGYMERPGAFPDAAAFLKDDIGEAQDLVRQMRNLQIPGRRFDLQRDVYVAAGPRCLDIAQSAQEALSRGDNVAAAAIATPYVRCFVNWKQRGADVAYR